MTHRSRDECLFVLESLSEDNQSSSTAIALNIIECSSVLFKDVQLKSLLIKIAKSQSSMAAVINISYKIIDIIDSCSQNSLIKLKSDFENSFKQASNSAVEYLKGVKSVATISFSKSVFDTLIALKPESVCLSVAYPAREGEKLASVLKEHNIDVVLFEDSAYSLVIKSVECVIVGADAIFRDSFVNKTGTYALALLAREFNIPFYVVSSKYKYLSNKALFDIKDTEPSEITDIECKVLNRYFEEIPLRFVNKMFVR
jgi:translation initiation factor eIF-2B subunit alpha